MAKEKGETVKAIARLPKALVRAAQHYALDHDTTFQAVLTQALEQFMRNVEKKGGRS